MIIDCLMNLSLLYWATEETKDPRFAAVAKRHADTALEKILRKDGSSNHIVVMNPENGEVLEIPEDRGTVPVHPGQEDRLGQCMVLLLVMLIQKKRSI